MDTEWRGGTIAFTMQLSTSFYCVFFLIIIFVLL